MGIFFSVQVLVSPTAKTPCNTLSRPILYPLLLDKPLTGMSFNVRLSVGYKFFICILTHFKLWFSASTMSLTLTLAHSHSHQHKNFICVMKMKMHTRVCVCVYLCVRIWQALAFLYLGCGLVFLFQIFFRFFFCSIYGWENFDLQRQSNDTIAATQKCQNSI